MQNPEHPMARDIPLTDLRDGFTPQTSDGRGSLPNPSFTLVTSIDNGQVYNPTTGECTPPHFGNCC